MFESGWARPCGVGYIKELGLRVRVGVSSGLLDFVFQSEQGFSNLREGFLGKKTLTHPSEGHDLPLDV